MKIKIQNPAPLEKQIFSDKSKHWFVSRLIDKAKGLPVQTMPISGLNLYHLAPNIDNMKSFVGHVQAVLDADPSFPIILDDEGYVMDGRHRIAKALLSGREEISFVRFEETPKPDYHDPEEK